MTLAQRRALQRGLDLDVVPLNSEGWEFHVAKTETEVKAVFDFVRKIYEEKGLADGLDLSSGDNTILERARTGDAAVIYANGVGSEEIGMSVSSVVGTIDQLPCYNSIMKNKNSPQIMDNLADEGIVPGKGRVWEIGRLAHSVYSCDTRGREISEMTRAGFHFGRLMGGTDLITLVNPETSKRHQQFHGFESKGVLDEDKIYKKGGEVLWFNNDDVSYRAIWTGRPIGIRGYLEKPLTLDHFEERYGASKQISEKSRVA